MTIFVYNTPYIASPVNDRRGGTYRVGSDNPDPIQVTKGWDSILYFAFRNHTQRVYQTTGQTITARMFNTENVEVFSKTLISDPLVDGAAQLIITASESNTLLPGLHSLVIEVTDEFNRTQLAQTTRSKPRFVVEILDQTTVDLNN